MEKNSRAPVYKGCEFIRAAAGGARDILTVLLKPDATYTEEQVNNMVNDYLNAEVKS